MHMDVEIIRQKLCVLVDTRATYVFVFKDMAMRFGLKIEKTRVILKIVNTKEILVTSLARGVQL